MKKIILAILTLATGISLFAQEKEATKPIELPAFIIEGVEQLNVKSGIKQLPAKIAPLDTKELDSLNSFEKQQPSLLAPDPLPEHYVTKPMHKGFLKGSYGIFNTPEVVGGYGFEAANFDIFAQAGFNYSGGDAKNSEYNKFFLDVNSDYIADDKFFIFGGSRTRTGFVVNSQSYNFYGNNERPDNTNYYDRNLARFKFYVDSEGSHENLMFNVGGSLNIMNASNSSNASKYVIGNGIKNNYVQGFLTVKNYWQNFLVGGNVFIDFESVGGNSVNFYQFDGSASYFDENFSLLGKIGFQIANNSEQTDRGGLLLLGNMEYRMSKLFTIKAEVSSGLEKQNFEDLIYENPYLSAHTFMDYAYNIAKIRGVIWFHPTEKMALSAGIQWRYTDRYMIFAPDSLAEFKFNYIDGTIGDLFGEAFWNITHSDRLVANININMNAMNDEKNLTYMPNLKLGAAYFRKWFDKLGTTAEIVYVGERYISENKNDQIDAYLSLNLGAEYSFKNFSIFLNVNNITNSNIYVWDKYKERGLFLSLALMWQF